MHRRNLFRERRPLFTGNTKLVHFRNALQAVESQMLVQGHRFDSHIIFRAHNISVVFGTLRRQLSGGTRSMRARTELRFVAHYFYLQSYNEDQHPNESTYYRFQRSLLLEGPDTGL